MKIVKLTCPWQPGNASSEVYRLISAWTLFDVTSECVNIVTHGSTMGTTVTVTADGRLVDYLTENWAKNRTGPLLWTAQPIMDY